MARFEGVVEKITYRNEENGFTVAQIKLESGEHLAAVGAMPILLAGERAAFEGELVEHREYGRQIRVSWVESVRPESLDGIEKYLASGLIRGVGPATASSSSKASASARWTCSKPSRSASPKCPASAKSAPP